MISALMADQAGVVAAPGALDIAFVVLFAVAATLFETLVFFPRFKAAVAAGDPDARLDAYWRTTAGQWIIAAMAIALWAHAGRPWAQLGLHTPVGYGRIVAGIVVVGAMAVLVAQQVRAIRRLTPGRRLALATKVEVNEVAFLLPHTAREHRRFMLLSITAGVCEELLYRGFLTWVAQGYVGLPAAVAISVVAFGAGHSYQGWRGTLKTGAVGLVMSVIVLVTGWLVPAMIVHALIDLAAGELGCAVLGQPNKEPVVSKWLSRSAVPR